MQTVHKFTIYFTSNNIFVVFFQNFLFWVIVICPFKIVSYRKILLRKNPWQASCESFYKFFYGQTLPAQICLIEVITFAVEGVVK